MTPQEAQMLQQLVEQVARTPLNEKDPDAEALLKDGLARDPDALYKLAQIVLVQDISLHQAQARIQQLTAEAQQQPAPPQPARTSSFLGNLFHRDEPAPSSQPYGGTAPYQPVPNAPPPPQYAQPQYPPPSQYAQPQYAQPSEGSSFLRSAATTAAGVAAGALAFEGIESLFHHGMGGFGSPMGFGGGMPVEETVINNTYIEEPSQSPDFNNQDFQQQNPFDNSSFDSNQGFDNSFNDTSSFDDGGFDPGDDLI
ncbi:MAG: DUF2076 domain-containing protein [Acidobacteriaceae bacterium]